jgi:large subunit ribosomal protein L15
MSMLHNILASVPRYKKSQRKGRGESSGRGKTSGRGNKGSKARTGTTFKRGHEHGQTPTFRRFPKRGFSNFDFERRFYVVNLADLAGFEDGSTVDGAALVDQALIPDLKLPVKILGTGDITKKLTVVAGWYSKSAHDKIIAAGGTVQNAAGEAFAFPKPKKKFIPRDPVKKVKAGEEAASAPAAVAAPAEAEKPA